MAGDYQVRVTREMAGYDDYGVPCVTRTPARVEITTSGHDLVFDDRAALQQFIDQCVRAGHDAFGAPPEQRSSDKDAIAWRHFFNWLTRL